MMGSIHVEMSNKVFSKCIADADADKKREGFQLFVSVLFVLVLVVVTSEYISFEVKSDRLANIG